MGFVKSFRIKMVGALVLLLAAMIFLSYNAGVKASIINKQRLIVVWPGLMNMEQRDRGILVMLARSCNLGQVEPERHAVIECLQSATGAEGLILPRSMNREQVVRRFEELLEQAQPGKL